MDIIPGKTLLASNKISHVYFDEATGDIDVVEQGGATTTITGQSNGMLLVAASNYLIRASRQELFDCDKQLLREMMQKIKSNLFLADSHKIETLYPVTPGEIADRMKYEATAQIEELTEAEIAQINAEEAVANQDAEQAYDSQI